MELTKQEIEKIEAEASKAYPMTEDSTFNGMLQDGYRKAATAYALKAKGLVEALEKIDKIVRDSYIQIIVKDALSSYTQPLTGE